MVVQLVAGAADLREPRRRRSVGIADELDQDLGAVQLDRIWHRRAGLPHHAEHLELGGGPLAGQDLPAEGGAVGHRPGLPAAAYATALDVAGVPVESGARCRGIAWQPSRCRCRCRARIVYCDAAWFAV